MEDTVVSGFLCMMLTFSFFHSVDCLDYFFVL